MARIGSDGDVSLKVGSSYDGSGFTRAKGDVGDLSEKVRASWEKMEQAQRRFGITSQNEKMSAVQAYKALENAQRGGLITTNELTRAKIQLNQTLGAQPPLLERMKGAWLQIGVGIAAAGTAIAWLKGAAVDAYNAEVAFNKLRIQLEGMGRAYDDSVKKSIEVTSNYALVQKEDVAKTLQELILVSGDYTKSLQNLNLVYDLAYQKGISQSEAARMVGMAMTGNAEALGRHFIELRNLNEKLGENATESQKAAFAMEVLATKTNDAMSEMTEHEKKVREVSLAYHDLKESSGEVLIDMAYGFVLAGQGIAAFIQKIKDERDFVIAMREAGKGGTKEDREEYERLRRLTLPEGFGLNMPDPSQIPTLKGPTAEEIKRDNDKALVDKKAVEVYKKSEEAIFGVIMATEKLGAGKERLNELLLIEAYRQGATSEQVARLSEELDNQIAKEEQLAVAKDYQKNEETIFAVVMATEKMGASKERLNELLAIEAYRQGATSEQVERYLEVLGRVQEKEEEIEGAKEAKRLEGQLDKLGEAPGIQSPFGIPSEVEEMFTMQSSLERLQIYHAERLSIIGQYSNDEAAFLQAAAFANLQIETQANQMRLASAMNTANMMMQVANILYVAGGSKNKALFVMMKAFAFGQAVMAAYQASALALAHPPGPPATIPLAAMALKMGLLNAGMIAAQTVAGFASGGGGGGGGGGIGSTGGGGIGTIGVSSPVPFREVEQTRTPVVNIHVYGNIVDQDKFARELVPSIQKAMEDKAA